MKYALKVVSLTSLEFKTIVVDADEDAVNAAPCPQTFVQRIARPFIPAGFIASADGFGPVQ